MQQIGSMYGQIRVSHGSYRTIAFSASITETTTYEYDPRLQHVRVREGDLSEYLRLRAPERN